MKRQVSLSILKEIIMGFDENDLQIIRYRLKKKFPALSMSIHRSYPVMNGTRCAIKPSGTTLTVRVLPIGRVWLVAADEGFTLDDVIPNEWHNCLHHEDGHIEYMPEFITTTEAVVEWISGFVR